MIKLFLFWEKLYIQIRKKYFLKTTRISAGFLLDSKQERMLLVLKT